LVKEVARLECEQCDRSESKKKRHSMKTNPSQNGRSVYKNKMEEAQLRGILRDDDCRRMSEREMMRRQYGFNERALEK